jgi:hypothetical protein
VFHMNALTGADITGNSLDDAVLEGQDIIQGPIVEGYLLNAETKVVVLLDEFLQVRPNLSPRNFSSLTLPIVGLHIPRHFRDTRRLHRSLASPLIPTARQRRDTPAHHRAQNPAANRRRPPPGRLRHLVDHPPRGRGGAGAPPAGRARARRVHRPRAGQPHDAVQVPRPAAVRRAHRGAGARRVRRVCGGRGEGHGGVPCGGEGESWKDGCGEGVRCQGGAGGELVGVSLL